MPQVFLYDDYRQFLRDFYKEKKQESSFFSYRYLGGKVGMDAAFVMKVLQGSLHISEKKIPEFVKLCKLSEREAKFFDAMVRFNKARTAEAGRPFLEQMLSIRDYSSLTLVRDQYAFFTTWYHSAVWCTLDLFPCQKNFADLAARIRPQISAAEAKESVKLLERLGLVACDEDGAYRSTQENLTTGKAWQSIAIQQYQREMIRLAGEAIERFPKEVRDISTLTLNLDAEGLEEVRAIAEEFRRAAVKASNRCDKADRVYQMNLQVFPISGVDV